MKRLFILLIVSTSIVVSCGDRKEKTEQKSEAPGIAVPVFNADSAYWFVAKQVSFGPRIPNTRAHLETGDFIISVLKKYGASITIQEFHASSFDGKMLSLRNIIASFNPKKQKRILLAAHWDTRPFADKDPTNPQASFDGANDGASGVAVLLEVARHLEQGQQPEVGVDLIFFDGEDWGERNDATSHRPPPAGKDSWWCLGSQHWSKNKHKANYQAQFGIVIDMVGAHNAHFFQEGNSVLYAPRVVDKVWDVAARLGYSSVFIRQKEEGITDDHLFVNELAKIPTIDIVHFEPGHGFFGKEHHTQNDNLSLISKETLGMVGRVLMHVIYYEE